MCHCTCLWPLVILGASAAAAFAEEATALRLVPFPKEVTLQAGTCLLDRPLVLEVPDGATEVVGRLLADELRRAGMPAPTVRAAGKEALWLRLSAKGDAAPPKFQFRDKATPEDYALDIGAETIAAGGAAPEGLFHAAQTLCQLIRANRRGNGLPCLTIRDWPSLRWRCFQDDLTRGASSTLDTLKSEARLGAALKLNLFTYYMEYQYAFRKHPKIGPKDGSLTPEDLRALVEYAKPLHVDILGNQQSFGHFERILQHPEYAAQRETGSVLCPVKEETYQLLDDLYSEVCPLLPFEMFNVCCDETWGLGNGPSKTLAQQIGVGGVYVRHIRRVHDLLKEKYKKRMMMWGDIILQHPDKLAEIPKDTVMLTWGYDPREHFDDKNVPYAKSGYEFFVCPGINNWSRILPDFGVTTANVRNFVRDGVKHGAIGMLNTAWEDDGEALKGYNWHGYAWGAECAWNASATSPEDFNRRIGAVLFGEKEDRFGRAIELLAQTHRLASMDGMNNSRFWRDDLSPRLSPSATRASAERLLKLVQPAIEHLEACKKEATVNAELLDSFLLGARRAELIGKRMLDGLQAAQAYTQAYDAKDQKAAVPLVADAEERVRGSRDAHEALGREFKRIWLAESRPYALDWTMARYASAAARFDKLAAKLAEARKNLEAGKPLPRPEDLGLAVPTGQGRRTRPDTIAAGPLAADAPWAEAAATHRLAIMVNAGSADRYDLPVELDVALPEALAAKPVRAFVAGEGGAPRFSVLAQLDALEAPGKVRLVLLLAGPLLKNTQALVHVYLGLPGAPPALPEAVVTRDGQNGSKWVENDQVRLLLGREGAHIYRWEVKALGNRDLTMPGETGWSGFSDLAQGHRETPHELACAAHGPALVRYVCTDATGLAKTVSLFGGVSWAEVVLNEPVGHYWDFDNPKNFAADGPTPGTYLFSNGATGALGREADGVPAQVEGANTYWGVKFNAQKLALGLLTPETAALHHIAPGAGAGGVGIENSAPTAHFVTFAGVLRAEPAESMRRLQETLSFKNPPQITLGAVEARK
ncbi:MAG: beta-N-acetylhexosaminidase [Planctomycetota bacterium]|nr:beta-N-acetylhexosaminidase [Planctomycetota bacterium]